MNTEDKLIQESLDIKQELNVLEKEKMDHQDSFITACILGIKYDDDGNEYEGPRLTAWNKKADQLNHAIETRERKLEELIAFIAVGYPAYKTVNASSVLDVYKEKVREYKRKMVIYNAKQSGISISDDHVIMDDDDPLGVMNM